jgi:hypothetical protein
MFTLVVDDFGIQYNKLSDTHHLLAALKQNYEAVTVDWTGSLFCGITLKWNYPHCVVDLSIPGYVQNALEELNHPAPAKPEHQPHQHNPLQYSTKTQLSDLVNTSPPLGKQEILRRCSNHFFEIENTKFMGYYPPILVQMGLLGHGREIWVG